MEHSQTILLMDNYSASLLHSRNTNSNIHCASPVICQKAQQVRGTAREPAFPHKHFSKSNI